MKMIYKICNVLSDKYFLWRRKTTKISFIQMKYVPSQWTQMWIYPNHNTSIHTFFILVHKFWFSTSIKHKYLAWCFLFLGNFPVVEAEMLNHIFLQIKENLLTLIHKWIAVRYVFPFDIFLHVTQRVSRCIYFK